MKSGVFAVVIWVLCSSLSGPEDSRKVEWFYIERFAPLAVEEMHRVGIPASIKLAQAVIESNSGRSVLAVQSNNHFGIKCKSWWKGQSYYHKDDDLDARGRLMESCFRAYADIESSFRDHSDFLKSSPNYIPLFKLDPTDYKGWATGLRSCGYATDKSYADKLIRTVETFQLYRYDTYKATIYDLPADKGRSPSSLPRETTVD